VARYRIARETIEIETGDSRFQPPPLEIVVVLLAFPAGGSAPFGNQAFAVGFDEGEGFVVVGFEEEGDAEEGEFDGEGRGGGRVLQHRVDCAAEMLLPDVPVGSHRI